MCSPRCKRITSILSQEFDLLGRPCWFDCLTNNHVFLFFLLKGSLYWCFFSTVLHVSVEGDLIPTPVAEPEVNHGNSIALVVDWLSNG